MCSILLGSVGTDIAIVDCTCPTYKRQSDTVLFCVAEQA
jgi:hypothetical protein